MVAAATRTLVLSTVAIALMVPSAVLPGFVSVVTPHGNFASLPRASPDICRLQAAKTFNLLSSSYRELCSLIGERDARSAWNLYRIGRDPTAASDAADGIPTGRKFTVCTP